MFDSAARVNFLGERRRTAPEPLWTRIFGGSQKGQRPHRRGGPGFSRIHERLEKTGLSASRQVTGMTAMTPVTGVLCVWCGDIAQAIRGQPGGNTFPRLS
jgi:hypothetical protein